MPLLRKNGKELIFVHIPKCGGTSIEHMFNSDVQMTLFHNGPGELPCSPQHFQASLLEKLFDYRMPASVVVVRNPLDRLVSEFRYQVQNGLIPEKTGFDKFVENSLGEFWKNRYVHDNHIRPQVEFICTESIVFRFEEEGVKAACKHISDYFGISVEGSIPIKNASESVDFTISPETMRLINRFYSRDFELLGYANIDTDQSERNYSSLNYSAIPTAALSESTVIRQRVSNDIAVISEKDKVHFSKKLEHIESERRVIADAASDLAQKIDQQSTATTEIKALLDTVRSEVEIAGKNLAAELNRLNNSLDTSGQSIEGVKAEFAGLTGLAATLESLDKSLGQIFDSVGGLKETFSSGMNDKTTLLEQKLLQLGRELDVAVGKGTRDLGSAITSQNILVSESINGLRESLISGMTEKSTHLEQKLSGIDRELDEATSRVIRKLGTSIGSQTAQISESVDELKIIFNSGMSERTAQLEQKLSGVGREFNESIGRGIRELSSSLGSQSAHVTEHVDGLKDSLILDLEEKAANIEQKLVSIGQVLDHELRNALGELHASIQSQSSQMSGSFSGLKDSIDSGIATSTSEVGQKLLRIEQELGETVSRIVGDVTSSTASQVTQISESVNRLDDNFSTGLEAQTAILNQKLSGIESGLHVTADKIIGALSGSTESQATRFSRYADEIAQTVNERAANLAEILSEIERALAQISETKDFSASKEQQELLNQYLGLFEIQQRKIQELEEHLVSANSQLAEKQSRELHLGSRLEHAQELGSKFKENLEALTVRTSTLEREKLALEAENNSLGRRFEELRRNSNVNSLAWDKEKKELMQESLSLQRTVDQLQVIFDAKSAECEQEKSALEKESGSLKIAICEVQHTLITSQSAWHQEKEALELEVGICEQRITELTQQEQELREAFFSTSQAMQQSEDELKNELKRTLDRFHVEIDYRDALMERIRVLEIDLDHVRQHNKSLLESNSFRVTKPLRVLSRALKPRRQGKKSPAQLLRLEDLRRNTGAHPANTIPTAMVSARNSQLSIAIVVENLDRGGLEQVVLDHARYFSKHCKSLDLFVINETGQVYEQALNHGIHVLAVKDPNFNLDEYLRQNHYDFAFFHHSYGYLPAFRPYTNKMVEVIHNEYSWQTDIDFFINIRQQTIDKFIAVSDPVRDYSISKLGIKDESIVTIVNGLNIEGLIRPPLNLLHERRVATLQSSPTFIMCANGQPQKNHTLVIRAFEQLLSKYPQAKLQLAGNLSVDGEVERSILLELEKSRSSASIELTGSLNRRALSRLLAGAHVALLPTKYEGFSIATLEYLYFGLPMILSNTGGAGYIANNYHNVIIDKKIGRLEGPPTPAEVKSLAGHMRKMLVEYDTFLEKSERAARSYSDYTVETTCLSYLN